MSRQAGVNRRGGMVRRTCTGQTRNGSFTCWRVDPARAQGHAAFAARSFGPSPITAPFYVYSANGREYRHWLRADTGYAKGIWASRPLGANARTSLSWRHGDGLADVTGRGGGGGGGGTGQAGGGAGFSDVKPKAWYLEALTWGIDTGLVSGFDDGTFRPGLPISRALAVAWLWSREGEPAAAAPAGFTDVGPNAWFVDALAWAAAEGIVTGYADGTYRPSAPVNRAQFAAMLWNAAGRPTPSAATPPPDVRPGAWHATAVAWVIERGYASGFPDGTFRPADEVNRAQGVSWLHASRP